MSLGSIMIVKRIALMRASHPTRRMRIVGCLEVMGAVVATLLVAIPVAITYR
jgi:hypothetical protein